MLTVDRPRILDAPKVGKESPKRKTDKASETARINTLVEMDKRRKWCRGARDKQGLIDLAGEYLLLNEKHGGCPNTASQILLEAESL